MKHAARIAALAMAIFGVVAGAQQAPAPSKPAADPAPPAATPATPVATPPASPASDAEAVPPPPATGKGSPQRFEPTEKVRPDFDVAFPVDI